MAISGITIQTGYNWQKAWNYSGMNSIMPNYGGGRPASMTPEQKSRFEKAMARDMRLPLRRVHSSKSISA